MTFLHKNFLIFGYATGAKDEQPQITKTKCSPRQIYKNVRMRLDKIASFMYLCNSEFTEIILGSLRKYGLELTNLLVLIEVKKLVLASRTGGHQASRLG